MKVTRLAAAVAVLIIACSHGQGWAQSYPAKPVRVVIPWPPGGSNDIVGRIVAQKLSEMTGQQFVIAPTSWPRARPTATPS